jgi:hypothetical protein
MGSLPLSLTLSLSLSLPLSLSHTHTHTDERRLWRRATYRGVYKHSEECINTQRDVEPRGEFRDLLRGTWYTCFFFREKESDLKI